MKATTPRDVIDAIDAAFEAGDVDAIVGQYDDHAVQVRYMDGSDKGEARGTAAIRALYAGLLEPGKFKVEQLTTHVVETDGVALFTSRWRLEVGGGPPKAYVATIVLRRQADGSWKTLIDSGPSVLEP